jgi:predicted DNA-binding transcriptional regulator AlpA
VGSESQEDLIDMAELQAMLGVSRGRAYTISRDRSFPEPAITRPRFRAWRRSDVEAWLDEHRPKWRTGGKSSS